MTLLVLGVLLWWAAHTVKPAFPEARARLDQRLGEGPAKGLFAVLLTLSVVLMVVGYGAGPVLWVAPAWATGVNNLAMLASVALIGGAAPKSPLKSVTRHPMLWGVVVWAAAHLLVNGDVPSLVLFGGIGAWALATMVLLDRRDGRVWPESDTSAKRWIKLGVITLVVYAVITAIHAWLGVWPFGG